MLVEQNLVGQNKKWPIVIFERITAISIQENFRFFDNLQIYSKSFHKLVHKNGSTFDRFSLNSPIKFCKFCKKKFIIHVIFTNKLRHNSSLWENHDPNESLLRVKSNYSALMCWIFDELWSFEIILVCIVFHMNEWYFR